MTFAEGVKKPSVSLDGGKFDPSGTLTGGSRPHTQSILTQLGELCAAEAALQEHQQVLGGLEEQLVSCQSQAAKYGILLATLYCGLVCPGPI